MTAIAFRRERDRLDRNPHNHDCDFSKDDIIRNSLIMTLKAKSIEANDAVISTLTAPQTNYFSFSKALGLPSTNQTDSNLLSVININLNGKSIRINCINSAWMSELKEKQGTLVPPLTSGLSLDKADLAVTLFHHPFNWFDSEAGRQFRAHVEIHSDLILTGHEHEIRHISQSGDAGQLNEIVEGGELQGTGASKGSFFNTIFVDLEQMEFEVNQYSWSKGVFKKADNSKRRPLRRSEKLQQIKFTISPEFAEHLNDPGVVLTHPRKEHITLDQIFVLPDFKRMTPSSDPTNTNSTEAVEIVEDILRQKRVLIVGGEKSGKTSLAKHLFAEYHRRGLVPILIEGPEITASTDKRLKKLIDSAITEQYSEHSIGRYHQTPKTDRLIIVDDFQRARLNSHGKNEFLKLLLSHTDRFLLFTDDLSPLGDMLGSAVDPSPLFKASTFTIKEMGHLRRERLIQRWLCLGQEHSISDEDLIRETNQIANGISSVLREKVIPAHPIMVLSVIQMLELQSPLKTAQGTYGYFYEMMLTNALSNKWKPQVVDKLYTYLSVLAYSIFSRKSESLSHDQIKTLTRQHETTYAIEIDLDDTLIKLCECKILTCSANIYEFRYKYLYYYFVARYFRDNAEEPQSRDEVRAHIVRMAASVHVEEHANVLIFLSYLAKNPIIIDEILKNAQLLHKDHQWCDLEGDIKFATTSSINQLNFAIETTDAKTTRERELRRRDQIDEESPSEQQRMEHQTQELQQINSAFRTLEIMGQIARNFSGSLRADTKLKLTEECYGLGLRTLKAWLAAIETNLPLFRRFLDKHLQTEENIDDPIVRDKQISLFIFVMTEILSFAILKKISEAVGTEELSEIYSRVLNAHPTKAVELVNIAIKLDHFHHMPMQEMIEFHTANEKSYFLTSMLKIMAIEHFYMFPEDRGLRERVCDRLGITKNDPLMISEDNKKFKKRV